MEAIYPCEEVSTAALPVLGNETGIKTAAPRHPIASRWVLASALIIYLALAFTLARVKTPWVDEGWFGSPAVNWSRTGSTGTLSLDETGSWLNAELTGIHQHTYWILPSWIFVQGLWYKLFGFTLLKMRSLNIAFGFLAILAWYVVVRELSGSRLAGSFTAAILAFDITFLWTAADGRMDMMCAALGAAGLAVYLDFREKYWNMGLWLANICVALSMFTHPNGVVFLLSLAFLVFYFDRCQVGWRNWVVIIPYLILAVAVGFYTSTRPDYFWAQFDANSRIENGVRWEGFSHPLTALVREIGLRYFRRNELLMPVDGAAVQYGRGIVFLYWCAAVGYMVTAALRSNRRLRALLVIAALPLAFLTWAVGHKIASYLILAVPSYAAFLATWVGGGHRRGTTNKAFAAIVLGALMLCQMGAIASQIRGNAYRSEYVPTIQFLRNNLRPPAGRIIADSYFALDLGFSSIVDDARLGYYSGTRADVIVEDKWYGIWWNRLFPAFEPEVGAYARHLLTSQYTMIFQKGQFKVYRRRQDGG